jgi:hypothetical protein
MQGVRNGTIIEGIQRCFCMVWGDFLSFYSRFYKVIIFRGTHDISEAKKQNVYLDIEFYL